jgi:hypothetical protein
MFEYRKRADSLKLFSRENIRQKLYTFEKEKIAIDAVVLKQL